MQRRKPNYSPEEMKFLINKYREHQHELNGSKHLRQAHREEIWRKIYAEYRAALPKISGARTCLDVKRKMIKLRSEAQVMFKREKMRARGQDISRLSTRAKRMVMSRAHKMMLKVIKGYAIQPYDEEDDKEEDSPPYIDYEDDDGFLPCDDDDDNSNQEADDGDEYIDEANDDDENEDDDDDHTDRIMQQLLFPNEVLGNDNIFGCTPSTAANGERLTTPTHRKGHDERSATIQSILDLQREKMMIERDNLILEQRKLTLEVKLLEKRLLDTGGRLDASGSGLDGRATAYTNARLGSQRITHVDGFPSDNTSSMHTPDIKVQVRHLDTIK